MNLQDLDERTQQALTYVLSKDIVSLKPYDKMFLQARREYLTPEQQEKYATILDNPIVVEEVEEAQVPYKELQKKAAALGADSVVGVSREDLETFIRTAEGPAGAPQPE